MKKLKRYFRCWTVLLFLIPGTLMAQSSNKSTNVARRIITLEWEPVSDAIGYQIEFRKYTKEGSPGKSYLRKTKKSIWKSRFPYGKYDMRIRSYDSRSVPGEWSEPINFAVKPPAVTLIAPENQSEIKSIDNEIDVTFRWSRVPGIKKYKFLLNSSDGDEEFQDMINDNKLERDLDSDKSYNWTVIPITSEGLEGDRSDPFYFKITKQLPQKLTKKLEESVNKNEEDAQKFNSNFYYVASYLISQIEYSAIDKSKGTSNSLSVLGGTGRLGAGYLGENKKWSVFGIADLGGIQIESQNYTFASGELHGVYHLNYSYSEIQISGGLYYKQLPYLISNNTTKTLDEVSVVTNMGPHAGLDFQTKFNKSLGMRTNLRIYYALTGSGPNGESLQSELSYQLGIFGSYQLAPNYLGFAGVTYRLDKASFSSDTTSTDSVATSGDVNSMEMTGAYLNFILNIHY